jgi:hypothetical protein
MAWAVHDHHDHRLARGHDRVEQILLPARQRQRRGRPEFTHHVVGFSHDDDGDIGGVGYGHGFRNSGIVVGGGGTDDLPVHHRHRVGRHAPARRHAGRVGHLDRRFELFADSGE